MKSAVVKDPRAFELQVVPGRSADHADATETILERMCYGFLTQGQTVNQEQAESVPGVRTRCQRLQPAQQLLRKCPTACYLERLESIDPAGDGTTGASGKAHA